MSAHRLGPLDDLPAGAARVVEIAGRSVALCRLASGELYAIENRCTHDDGPLGEGELEGEMLECPRHGALFDVTTGQARTLPAVGRVDCFPVSLVDGELQIDLPNDLPTESGDA